LALFLSDLTGLDSSHQSCNQMTLFLGQVRMPDVEDEDDTCPGALISGFVFNRIVENPRFAPLPQADLIANSKPTAIWNQQGQMADQTRVQKARMRGNPSTGC
jgi:hypothetical protein